VLQKTEERINGWSVKYQPDFVKFYTSSKYLERLNVGGSEKAKQIIDGKIQDICNSANPRSSKYPKLGNMKWLRAKKGVKILEERLTGDYRILFLPTKPDENELTFYAIKNHSGVEEFLRDAHARVHNAAMDNFSIDLHEENNEYSVDMSKENAEAIVNKIQQELEDIIGEDEIEKNIQEFIEVSRTCSIYRLGRYGIELDPSPEQQEHINSPSPMLLPGVAGTGKSTVLQYRYRNSILSYGNNVDAFFKVGIYLTLNKPLAKSTRREVKKILSPKLANQIDSGIQDINSWVSALLSEDAAISTPNLTFDIFREWWYKRRHLQRYDPAQAWEEYRGVIKGTSESIKHRDGALSKDAYLSLPHDRCAYPEHERREFYTDIVEDFQEWRRHSDSVWYDDQDLIRKVSERKLPPLYKHIFIDEVQDLTELQLMVIMDMLKSTERCVCSSKNECNCPPSCGDCQCLVFDVTGDLSQQVYPTRFRWEDTKRAIFESQGKKCHERKPMSTSYRSVRSIVDLSSYYLEQMVSGYRQGGDINQAQSEQKAETPTILEAPENDLYEIIHDAGLPAAHCPIIVRHEHAKRLLKKHLKGHAQRDLSRTLESNYPNSKEVQKDEFQTIIDQEESRIESYIFTIAEAKGLEWNNIVLWEISSGSDHLLARKLHEQRGNYIDEADWNYQLELRHAFVATTRARLLLLHLTKSKPNYEQNPFYGELLKRELAVIEEEPLDLSRFSKSELTLEEYEEMAETYENKEMYGAAALIYKNNLSNPQKAKEMEYFEAKKRQDAILMAQHLISYEQNWSQETLGKTEKRHVIDLLDENGEDTELGYIIELANMLGLEEKAKLAELKRKERLASIFQSPETFASLALEYAKIGRHEKAGDYFARANRTLDSVKEWWKGKAFEKSWKAILNFLAPSESLEHELLLISILSRHRLEGSDDTLFKQLFGFTPTKTSFEVLKKLNVRLDNREFSFEESKKRVAELAYASLSVEERVKRFLKHGQWRLGLNLLMEDELLDLGEGLDFCNNVSQAELLRWYDETLEKSKPGSTWQRRMVFFEYLFSRYFPKDVPIARVKAFLLDLELNESKHQNIGASTSLQKWHHAVHCVNNAQDGNTGIGKANLSVLIRWYIEDETLQNPLLLHSIRCALFCGLEATYASFEKRSQRTLATKSLIREAVIVVELFIKTLMNPRRYSKGNYPRIRKALIGAMKGSEVVDFVDAWFDFFLDMSPDKVLLKAQSQLKRDIQSIFPLFRSRVSGYNDGLPDVGLYPDNSLTRRYDGNDKTFAFSIDGLAILKQDQYTRGQYNAVKRIVDDVREGNEETMTIYINQMILQIKSNADVEAKNFFDIIDEYLMTQDTIEDEDESDDKVSETSNGQEAIFEIDDEEDQIAEPLELEEDNEMKLPGDGVHQNEEEEQITHGEIIPEIQPHDLNEEGTNSEDKKHEMSPEMLLADLHEKAPENITQWFDEEYKDAFNEENGPFILGCYTMFIERLEQQPSKIDISLINEWLCFHEIMKVMRSRFQLQENPYQDNQRMAAQLQEVRRNVAMNKSTYGESKVQALISIR